MNIEWACASTIHKDLSIGKKMIYDTCGYSCTVPVNEAESKAYGASTFKINHHTFIFRAAKITPTKLEQFVTLWKRNENGITIPYHILDAIDLFVISVRKDNHFGQFIFSKENLCERSIISGFNKEGKRAIRVYPPWDKTVNTQAKKTQQWQLDFFLEVTANTPLDMNRANMLYYHQPASDNPVSI